MFVCLFRVESLGDFFYLFLLSDMENLQLNIHFDLVEKLNGLGLAPEYTSGLMDLHRELVWLVFFEHDISDEILTN